MKIGKIPLNYSKEILIIRANIKLFVSFVMMAEVSYLHYLFLQKQTILFWGSHNICSLSIPNT